jgi:epoxide hydrolase-like predicted phosphatase
MSIRSILFDLGGVLITIDWTAYRNDPQLSAQKNDPYPYQYEQLNADLVSFIIRLRPHYKLASICNGGSREALNRKFNLDKFFDLMVFDSEEGISKPDPRIYHLTLQRLNIQPYEAIFVDDKHRNLDTAQQLGIHTVLFGNSSQTITDIQHLLQTQPSSPHVIE